MKVKLTRDVIAGLAAALAADNILDSITVEVTEDNLVVEDGSMAEISDVPATPADAAASNVSDSAPAAPTPAPAPADPTE